MKTKYIEAWNFMEVYILYTTTYVCKQRVVALLLMELLSMMTLDEENANYYPARR